IGHNRTIPLPMNYQPPTFPLRGPFSLGLAHNLQHISGTIGLLLALIPTPRPNTILPAHLLIQVKVTSDISELNLPKECSISFPNGQDDLMNFEVTIRPDEGYYSGGKFTFTFQISSIYPHDPPKVKCKAKVYHPNIDLDGNVCLNILREDWNPILNINIIIYGLYHLFTWRILNVRQGWAEIKPWRSGVSAPGSGAQGRFTMEGAQHHSKIQNKPNLSTNLRPNNPIRMQAQKKPMLLIPMISPQPNHRRLDPLDKEESRNPTEEPNHEDPLNAKAAKVLRDNPGLFEVNVKRTMAGGFMCQTLFTRCI
ncbi:hypothetical protein M8C21_012371, partial [Ambrosia artemisiifolia]